MYNSLVFSKGPGNEATVIFTNLRSSEDDRNTEDH